jgi:uncharacterized membrane protein YcaP (DUF421 family)
MLLIFLCYLFSFCSYLICIYVALLIMEKIGKKRPSTMANRASLAAMLAFGPIMVQLIANAVSIVYLGWAR